MAEGDQTKAERRQARAAGKTRAERKQARGGGQTRAERRQGRTGRRRGRDAAAAPGGLPEDASTEERIESSLARIEEAIAAQAARTDELVERVNEVLAGTTESAESEDAS
jgi:hypothetical protein